MSQTIIEQHHCSIEKKDTSPFLEVKDNLLLSPLAAHHGPLIDVTLYLEEQDVIQLRSVDRALHSVITRGLYENFWTRKLGSIKQRRVVKLIKELGDNSFDNDSQEGVRDLFDFYEYYWTKRLSNRFKIEKPFPSTFQIKVCARFRPNKSGATLKTPFINDNLLLSSPKQLFNQENGRQWNLNHFLPPNATAEETFHRVAGARVQDLLCGLNGCILAYGQTGSGKSHAILGSENVEVLDGILPMCVLRILEFLKIDASSVIGSLTLSACEIYREKSRILSTPIPIPTLRDLKRVLTDIKQHRITSKTSMNSRSSRSHCIFTLQLRQYMSRKCIVSELKIVDLAGSERIKRACLDDFGGKERMKEGISINLSLSCLNRTINSLARRASHIPYNDSLLTRMLRNGLGGTRKNSSTVTIICCCSSDLEDFQETCSTLRFGEEASMVRLVCKSAAPAKFQSLIQLQTRLYSVNDEMRRLQELWTHAGEDRHEPCCRCKRCQLISMSGERLNPEHMPRWGKLRAEKDHLLLEIEVLRQIIIQRS